MNNKNFCEKVSNIKCVLLDLDGTVYLGNKEIPNAKMAVDIIRSSGVKIVYLTNNSSKTSEEYVTKLQKFGLLCTGDRIFTSGEATAKYLIKNGLDKDVYLLACDKVKESFIKFGVSVVQDKAKTAVLCYDTQIDYKKICAFNEQIVLGAKYIASHSDDVCPTEGVFVPDAGSFIKMFEVSGGRLPDVVIGKPNTFMGDIIMEEYGYKPNEIMMVGDRLYTDIRFGKNCGFLTALVLSGETTAEMVDVSPDKADGIFTDIYEIAKLFK